MTPKWRQGTVAGETANQPYWREGREFLKQELNGLRGQISIKEARILGDCYRVDLHGRMMMDI